MTRQFAIAPIMLLALVAPMTTPQAEPLKWRAVAILDGADSKNCGRTMVVKFDIDRNVNVLVTSYARGPLKIQGSLKPDGSGRVTALDVRNQPATLDFDPGVGPRKIRFTPPYSFCTWSWLPVS